MRNRAFRPIAAILSVMLLAGTPVHAGPVAISQVIQVLGRQQNIPELRLRSVVQSAAPISGVTGSLQSNTVDSQSTSDDPVNIADTSVGGVIDSSADSLLSGVSVGPDDLQAGLDVIAQGDVEGTICDCGEITVPGGGFPKWPLLFLAAIPFFFIHGCDDCDDKECEDCQTPTPTPTPEIPEPASLLLLGSGLAALGTGLRRRYGKKVAQPDAGEEG